jgi:hypothetical protein
MGLELKDIVNLNCGISTANKIRENKKNPRSERLCKGFYRVYNMLACFCLSCLFAPAQYRWVTAMDDDQHSCFLTCTLKLFFSETKRIKLRFT